MPDFSDLPRVRIRDNGPSDLPHTKRFEVYTVAAYNSIWQGIFASNSLDEATIIADAFQRVGYKMVADPIPVPCEGMSGKTT